MGVLKLAEAAMQMVTKKGMGLTPMCSAMAREMGNAKAAAALFVINSVNKLVIIKTTANRTLGL